MKEEKHNNQIGAVALISILIVMAVTLAVALSINLASISELKMGFAESKSATSLAGADACIDEALIRLTWDDTYTGGTLDLSGNSCIIGIQGSGDSRTIHTTSTVDILIRKIKVAVDMSGENLSITSWQEKTN